MTVSDGRRMLGARLRELRREAGLSGIELAEAAGWGQPKVSKIEQGRQVPTEDDLHDWCRITHAELALPDLIATARNVHAAYLEWRQVTRTGHSRRQRAGELLDAATLLVRGYAEPIPFALLQTEDYARAVLRRCIDFLDTPDDLDQAVAARMKRRRALCEGVHQYNLLLAEHALYTRVGDEAVRAGQLRHLLTLMELPRLALGILPEGSEFVCVVTNFTMFDRRVVQVETPSAELTVTQPRELALYERLWAGLQRQAVYGDGARALIRRALDGIAPG